MENKIKGKNEKLDNEQNNCENAELKNMQNDVKPETIQNVKNSKNKKTHKFLKAILIIIILILLVIIAMTISYKIYHEKQQESLAQRKTEIEALFIGEDKEIEYGTEVNLEELKLEIFDIDKFQDIDTYKLEINDAEIQEETYKFMQINNNEIKCVITEIDTNKKVLNVNLDCTSMQNFINNFAITYDFQKIEIEKIYNYNVIDTQKPVIDGVSDKEIYKGEEIDLKSGITASDSVDGELEVSIDGEVKKDEVGEYTITVKAVDKNSNESTAEFKVTVKEKPVTTANKITSNNTKTSSSSNKTTSSSSTTNSSSIATYTVMPTLEQEMFKITNQYRVAAGLKELTWDSTLGSIARKRSIAVAHLGADYYGWGHFATEYGDIISHFLNSGVSFSDVGENIAWNYSTKAAEKWLYNSAAHKAAMLGDFDSTGCGVCLGPDGEYLYVQVFKKN